MEDLNNIQPIILAGGLGTRLRSVVSDRPKVLANVNGNPFLKYLFEQLIDDGFENVLISCGYLGGMIKNYFGSKYKGLKITYSHEKDQLGTGGEIKYASKNILKDRLLILNGDTYFTASRKIFIRKVPDGKQAILTRSIEDSSRYGRLDIDKKNRITALHEKKDSNGLGLINTGTYLIDKNLILNFIKDKFSLENDYFPSLINDLKLFSVEMKGTFIDIGIPKDFILSNEIIKPINE